MRTIGFRKGDGGGGAAVAVALVLLPGSAIGVGQLGNVHLRGEEGREGGGEGGNEWNADLLIYA